MANKEIPDAWEQFMKEAKIAIETDEPLADFIERMQDGGFQVTHKKANLANERTLFVNVIRHFNKTCGTNYKELYPSALGNLIVARYREGYDEETMKRVINLLASWWKGQYMEKNLRPDIIFGPLKFAGYAGILFPIRQPASTPSPAPARPLSTSSTKASAPSPPKMTPLQSAQRDRDALSGLLETLFMWDQKKLQILLAEIPINIVWRFLQQTDRLKQIDPAIQAKAKEFAISKAAELKSQKPETDEEYAKKIFGRYYTIKSLFKGNRLGVVKTWPHTDHFIKNYQP